MQIDFPSSAGAKEALALLEPVYEQFKGQSSFADIIVLAGNVAVEKAGSPVLPFCPGRVDAEDGVTEQDLSPRTYYLDPLTAALDNAKVHIPTWCMHACMHLNATLPWAGYNTRSPLAVLYIGGCHSPGHVTIGQHDINTRK